MPKKVLFVGHCGPDSSYLRMVVRQADPSVQILMADDKSELDANLKDGAIDLILFNRELGYGFSDQQGVDVIRSLRPSHPGVKMMLVSNYPDAQRAAEQAGALPGFGKREIGTPKVIDLLKSALS